MPVFAMFRGWLALVFRLPTRLVTSRPEKPKLIKRVNDITILKGAAAQTAFLEKSLYFSSTLQKDKELQARKGGKKKNPQISNGAADEREKRRTDTSKKRGKRANEVIKAQANLSPLYESLYFSISAKEDHLLENMYEPVVPRRENCSKDGLCVMPFFLTEDNAEGRGMLERLREMQTQSREKESGPLAWVPALVSFALIALNPLK